MTTMAVDSESPDRQHKSELSSAELEKAALRKDAGDEPNVGSTAQTIQI